jgi:hypothetical protein
MTDYEKNRKSNLEVCRSLARRFSYLFTNYVVFLLILRGDIPLNNELLVMTRSLKEREPYLEVYCLLDNFKIDRLLAHQRFLSNVI